MPPAEAADDAKPLQPEPDTVKHSSRFGALKPFVIVSSSYLLFTITDGAVRMIVLLRAYQLGFSALEVAVMCAPALAALGNYHSHAHVAPFGVLAVCTTLHGTMTTT